MYVYVHDGQLSAINNNWIFQELSKSKNMVFNVKKLLDNCVDLTLRRGDGKSDPSEMSCRYCGFHHRACQCQHLPRGVETACAPLGPEDLPL
jgi:hypothetical protein